MKVFEDRFWSSRDGLKLHYRYYPASQSSDGGADGGAPDKARPPVLCMHGLTRNGRDFENLASRLSSEGWRVICPDMRGRGDSEYARDSATYTPMQYVEDVLGLIEQEQLDRFVAVGTSLGGLMTFGLALTLPGRIAGAVINDVGPVLSAAGLKRIRGYLGLGRSFPTWVHAARALEAQHGAAHPGHTLDFWIGMAKRMMTLGGSGRIVFDYDMKIAEPFAHVDPDAQPDLWPAWEALTSAPVLVVRGALSDLLSPATLNEMRRRAPSIDTLTLGNVGHAPLLDEPEALAAIERLLARVT